MPNKPHKAIEVCNLSLTAGKKKLLNSISFHVHSGERVAIVGANGVGKTTLLRALLGLQPSEAHSISIKGNRIESLHRKNLAQIISYVPQQLSENIPFTVIEFIIMSQYAHMHNAEKNALSAMQITGINHLKNQLMSTLSGGERQKVSITAALTQQTPILIFDEPSSHLDPRQRESIHKLLREIDPKTTILTVTHDINWAAADFDRIIGMLEGQILFDGIPSEIITSKNLHALFGAEWLVELHPFSGKPMILPTHPPI